MSFDYSSIQKISLAGMVLGAIMCLIGFAAPYWIVVDPQVPSFPIFSNLATKVIDGYMGLFMYCVESELLGEKKCEIFDLTEEGWILTSRITGGMCVVIGGLTGLSALFLACCRCCERLIALGIFAFIAAALGVTSIVVYATNAGDLTESIMGIKLFSYGWAFYVTGAGVGILALVSFGACFAAPDNRVSGMVLSQPAAATVTVASQHHNMQSMQPMAAPPGPVAQSAYPAGGY